MARSPAQRINVAFREALEALRRRLAIDAEEWLQILAEEGVVATAVADDTLGSVGEDLARAVLEVLEAGGTAEQFRSRYDEIVKDAGWSHKGNAGWHSRLVFRLHSMMAYSAGRWEQAMRLQANAPPGLSYFGRYITAGDHRVRETHALWHEVVLPLDHAFWQTHWTPNGFNCRCHVQVVNSLELRRFGWQITPDSDPRLSVPPDPGWDFNPGLIDLRVRQLRRAPEDATAG